MDESMRYTSYSRNEERFPYSTSGSFYCKKENEDRLLILTTVICAIMVGGALLLWLYLTWSWGFAIFFTAYTIFFVLLYIYLVVSVILCGEEYTYKADSDKFIITAPSGTARVAIIKYSEVENILYIPIYQGKNRHRGYKVIIKTKSAQYTYEYIMSFHNQIDLRKKGMKDTRELPFYIIEERSGLAEKPDLLSRAEKYDFKN